MYNSKSKRRFIKYYCNTYPGELINSRPYIELKVKCKFIVLFKACIYIACVIYRGWKMYSYSYIFIFSNTEYFFYIVSTYYPI